MQPAKPWQLALALVILLLVIGLIVYTWPATSLEPLPPTGTVEAARLLIEEGRFLEARAMTETIIAHEPDHAEAHFLLGWICLRLEDTSCAERELYKALALDPQRKAAVEHNLGVLAFSQNKLEEALQHFQTALEIDPDDLDTRYQLGAVYLVLAIPENAMVVDGQKLSQATAQFEAVLKAEPDKVEALVGLGNVRLIEGRYDEAVVLFERAVAVNPIPEALFALGRAYAMLGRGEEARVMLQRFLDTNPPTFWAEQAQELLGQLAP